MTLPETLFALSFFLAGVAIAAVLVVIVVTLPKDGDGQSVDAEEAARLEDYYRVTLGLKPGIDARTGQEQRPWDDEFSFHPAFATGLVVDGMSIFELQEVLSGEIRIK